MDGPASRHGSTRPLRSHSLTQLALASMGALAARLGIIRHQHKRFGFREAIGSVAARPLVGGALVLELVCRVILLFLFCVLSFSCPSQRRDTIMTGARRTVLKSVVSVRRLSRHLATAPGAPPQRSPPPETNILIVGAKGAGKATLCRELTRLARQAEEGEEEGSGGEAGRRERVAAQVEVASTDEVADVPPLSSLPHLALVLVVWHAGMDTPLSTYVARYVLALEARAAQLAPKSGAPPSMPRVLAVANRCDVTPCPIPEVRRLREWEVHRRFAASSPLDWAEIRRLHESLSFLAVSAARGTNLRQLEGLVSAELLRRSSSADAPTGATGEMRRARGGSVATAAPEPPDPARRCAAAPPLRSADSPPRGHRSPATLRASECDDAPAEYEGLSEPSAACLQRVSSVTALSALAER